MSSTLHAPVHTFHIPVMGTGFTVDTPLRVARFGISSVVSLVDDLLVEQMRERLARRFGRDHEAIGPRDEDSRARRITAYLDLLDELVEEQTERLRSQVFEAGSEITRYFEMLPHGRLRDAYVRMTRMADGPARSRLQESLRASIVRGAIDVNIMTKLDRNRSGAGAAEVFSDAMSSLRGFANSRLRSGVVLSAGLNLKLFSYLSEFEDFLPDTAGRIRKSIILKVGDLRSAAIQGKVLAKRGLWVSEFRIESGLNCGGHAFGGRGQVLGPILEEFRRDKDELVERLHALMNRARRAAGRAPLPSPLPVRLTVQGGIGTAREHEMLRETYGVDGTGWGSPFLLVPEAVSIDPESLERVSEAEEDDVHLSRSSPLGIPFWSLRESTSEKRRIERIEAGRPGSTCPKGYLRSNTEFTRTEICTASRPYQRKKLEELEQAEMSDAERKDVRDEVLAKACICHDLAGGTAEPADSDVSTAVCCGPNTVYFSRVSSLQEMVDHIYGRRSLPIAPHRPHMFLKELGLHLARLREDLERRKRGLRASTEEACRESGQNLLEAIRHYRERVGEIVPQRPREFLRRLDRLKGDLERLLPDRPPSSDESG